MSDMPRFNPILWSVCKINQFKMLHYFMFPPINNCNASEKRTVFILNLNKNRFPSHSY